MLYRKANGLRIAYDIVGDEKAPVVYFGHALASDMGMWAEQVGAFTAAGFRVLRADLRVLIRRDNSLEPIADTTLGRWLSPAFKARNPGRFEQIRETVASCTPTGYIGCAAAIQNFKWTDQLSKISAPTYVLCGEDDPGANPEENRMIAQTVQRGEFLAIPKARHLPNIEDPDGFNSLVINWCKRHN